MQLNNSTELQRLQTLKSYTVAENADDRFDDIINEATFLSGCPEAALTLVYDNRVWVKKSQNPVATYHPRQESFCSYGVQEPQLMEIPDATCDQRFQQYPEVKSGAIRYYAGAQIHSSDGLALGMLCVTNNQQHRLTSLQKQQLTDLASRISALLELFKN